MKEEIEKIIREGETQIEKIQSEIVELTSVIRDLGVKERVINDFIKKLKNL